MCITYIVYAYDGSVFSYDFSACNQCFRRIIRFSSQSLHSLEGKVRRKGKPFQDRGNSMLSPMKSFICGSLFFEEIEMKNWGEKNVKHKAVRVQPYVKGQRSCLIGYDGDKQALLEIILVLGVSRVSWFTDNRSVN